MHKMINLESTGLRRYARLANKPRQKYSLSTKLSLAVIGACEVAKNPHVFITISNQQIWEVNRHFDVTLNFYGPMVFASNREQNQSYTFKDIFLQPDKSYFILYMIKEIE